MLRMKYFVLKPAGDDIYAIASRNAMKSYARTIREAGVNDDDIHFSADIDKWVIEEQGESNKRDLEQRFAKKALENA